MDAEAKFIKKVFAGGTAALDEALDAGITKDHFTDPDVLKVWTFFNEYADEYNQLPSAEDIEFECNVDWEPGPEPVDALGRLITILHDGRKYGIYLEHAKAAREVAKADPSEALRLMREAVEKADDTGSVLRPSNLHDNWTEWFDAHWAEEGLTGIPTGFPTMDYATGGLKDQNLITMVGPPKAGKSTLMLKVAQTANVVYGKRVFFVTFEMTEDEQRERLACMISKANYHSFIQKTMPPKERARVRRVLERMEGIMPDFYMATDISAGTTVGALKAQIRKVQPHVVFVDGVYLMDAEVPGKHGMDPAALTTLTRNLKRMAQQLDVPVVITHQVLESRYAASKGIRSKDIGYSSSFAQDSDVVFGVEPTENPQEARLSIVLARAAAKKSTMLAWDWDTSDFSEVEGYEEFDPDDLDEPE